MASLIPVLSLVFVIFTVFCHFGEARLIVVGGTMDAWKVPESSNQTLKHWAESVRFRVGDILLFYYDVKTDSVLHVTKENYESCNTTRPLQEYKDGGTKVKLDDSGPYYFISGSSSGNCGKGEKLEIVVQSPNHAPTPKPGPAPTPKSEPAPSHSKTPTVAPAPAPTKNNAVGLVSGYGVFWGFVLLGLLLV